MLLRVAAQTAHQRQCIGTAHRGSHTHALTHDTLHRSRPGLGIARVASPPMLHLSKLESPAYLPHCRKCTAATIT